ncbi:MAG TPA: NADH-quinone oxidoreductase subunit H [Treponemataceae bacterium]|jgi:formate hydrogenlyase subunit 4|nr:NADH-quinone oxidoreductase subunit H [Treponemataceae bacterium]
MTTQLYVAIGYVLFAPIIGGLMAGIDRIITARMQGRKGPPLLQPFYDVFKLFQKQNILVNRLQLPFVVCHVIFAIFTGFLFFQGSDVLLIIFVLTLAGVFLVLAAYSTGSPFSAVGAERELLLMMGYEPMLIIALVGMYEVAGSFDMYKIMNAPVPVVLYLPGIYLGIVYILAIKLRKSPFDLSTSHHAHQELVKGITSDMGGATLALTEISHWYETVFLYGFLFIFFGANPIVGAIGVIVTFLLEIAIDNAVARVKWEFMLSSAWLVALIMGAGNLIPLFLINRG